MSKRLIRILLVLSALGYIGFSEYRWHEYRDRFADYEHVKDDAITAVHFPERAEAIRAASGK